MAAVEFVGGGGEGEELGEVGFVEGGDEGLAPGGEFVELGLGEGFDDLVGVVRHAGVAEEPVVDAVLRAGWRGVI